MGTGQANVKQYNRGLRNLIHEGKATPSGLVSHNLGLATRQLPTGISAIANRAGQKWCSTRVRDNGDGQVHDTQNHKFCVAPRCRTPGVVS